MHIRAYRRVIVVLIISCLLAIGLAPAGASSANISHSYKTLDAITNGSLVSLDKQKGEYVTAANTDNSERLLGVATASSQSLLAVDDNSGNVQVAISGEVNTLVSNLTGDIKVGDQIAASPFSGVGMKATPGTQVVGLAKSSFSSNSPGAVKRTITDKNGDKRSISVGTIVVSIGVGTDTTTNEDKDLNSLQRVAKSFTGRVIPLPRIIISIVITVASLLTLVTLIYAAIYGSIISIGRNPLAKYAVFRTLGSVIAMAVLIAIITVTALYLLLR